MSSYNTSGLRFFAYVGVTALSAFIRVACSSTGALQVSGPTGADIGILDTDVFGNSGVAAAIPLDPAAPVRLATCPGTKKYIADTAITAWSYVYKSNSGYVTNASGASAGGFSAAVQTLGIAAAPSGQTVAATALGSVFEVIPLVGLT